MVNRRVTNETNGLDGTGAGNVVRVVMGRGKNTALTPPPVQRRFHRRDRPLQYWGRTLNDDDGAAHGQ